jgi:transposase
MKSVRGTDFGTNGWDKAPAERVIKDIRRAKRRQFTAEEKIRIVLEGLRGEESIAEICRREGIASSIDYTWSMEFLEAGKRRLAGDTARAARPSEVKDLRHEAQVWIGVEKGPQLPLSAQAVRLAICQTARRECWF